MLEAIPIILLTARSDESRIIGAEIGADAFLENPLTPKTCESGT